MFDPCVDQFVLLPFLLSCSIICSGFCRYRVKLVLGLYGRSIRWGEPALPFRVRVLDFDLATPQVLPPSTTISTM